MKTLTQYINEVRGLGKGWKTLKSTDEKYTASFVAFEKPSKHGINDGRISKLYIKDTENDEEVCFFDGRWIKKPTNDVKSFYDKIINDYN